MSSPLSDPSRGVPHEAAGAIPLRLMASRGGVGIELSHALELGPLRVSELEWSLPGLDFPLDLSGGVREFRHRRGQLQRALLELDVRALGKWLESRLRGALGGLSGPVSTWCVEGGLGIGLEGQQGCLAFELLWAPSGEHARWVIARPRAAGNLPGPAIAYALSTVDAALGKLAKRVGRVVEMGPVLDQLVRALLPEFGVRVPATKGVWLSSVQFDDDRVFVTVDTRNVEAELPAASVASLELARLVAEADTSLSNGRVDDARGQYMSALERAPRHPELCQIVAAIDVDFEERAEAALGLLVESLSAIDFGLVGAELLARVGDVDGALAAIEKQARGERHAPLVARLWVRASELGDDPNTRALALDRALAACPGSLPARWARFFARVDVGDLNGALADAEHLEAAVAGARTKHEVIVAAARALESHGFEQPARRLFERALRHLPKDPVATFGLARCFARGRDGRRALVLLERAAELTPEDHEIHPLVQLELAKHLAGACQDLPQAIARARRVAGSGKVMAEARACEAKWRDQLGDLPGAAIAYGRLREALALMKEPPRELAGALFEGASFFERRGDVHSAQRQLATALELSPRDPALLAAFRRISEALLPRPAERTQFVDEPPVEGRREPDPTRELRLARALLVEEDNEPPELLQLELDAERLQARLLGEGALDAAELERLCDALERLGRLEALHAVLSSRHEDAQNDERAQLAPRLRQVLGRLERRALAAGDPDEAELYRAQARRL